MYAFKRNEIVILLGAGASVDAGIPHSGEMIRQVEKLVKEDRDWERFRDIYNFMRSSIYHSDGVRGRFGDEVNYNIERLVNTLEEIRKKQEHTLYPFVGAWNPTLVELAGRNFALVGELSSAIVKKLRQQWIALEDYGSADYFRGLIDFQANYQHPLRVFTLNYDLCVEKACAGVALERGFNSHTRKWDWRQFDDNDNDPRAIFLYKLHGSNDWTYDKVGSLTFYDETSRIEDHAAAIIFGTTYKLQHRDPFLFLAYEFRRWTLEARIIVCIGYGFGDEHINKIIQQALNGDEHRLLLSVSPLFSQNLEAARAQKQRMIAQAIEHDNLNQIVCCDSFARDFIKNQLTLDYLASLFPCSDENELFPIVRNE
ncbi:hypothetical protein TFLX_04014 [Thermoflexales bacterium]|nr:hypothetical protein TFLX_04014 [Thermoflexales bacterium]